MQLDSGCAYLLLGSNLGDRNANLKNAVSELNDKIGEVFLASSIYETEPWGNTEQPGFLNQAVALKTTLSPHQVLNVMLAIEKDLGRVRLEKWGERLIDIDLIFFDDLVIDTADLNVPHPLMHVRKFVLVPLNEIAANFEHPLTKQKISSILLNLSDNLLVTKIT